MKRERASSLGLEKSVKKRKTVTGNAIDGLTQSIAAFGENICKVLAVDPMLRTPARRKEALRLAQEEVWLSLRERLVFVKVLEKDINAVDSYIALDHTNVEFCHMWIQDKVDDAI